LRSIVHSRQDVFRHSSRFTFSSWLYQDDVEHAVDECDTRPGWKDMHELLTMANGAMEETFALLDNC
jgi:hypothetical protein